eukprot:11225457-Lingulodinium_polyedra.AAC.1
MSDCSVMRHHEGFTLCWPTCAPIPRGPTVTGLKTVVIALGTTRHLIVNRAPRLHVSLAATALKMLAKI